MQHTISLLLHNRFQLFRMLCNAAFGMLLFCGANVYAQSDSTVSVLQRQFTTLSSEQIFVHTDKAFYIPGETVWFKIYDLDSRTHALARWGSIAYVRLEDMHGRVLATTNVSLEAGTGSGSMYVPANVETGNITFRAFTRAMADQSTPASFTRLLQIINPYLPADDSMPPAGSAYTIGFYPEGGQMIAGLKSTVAFEMLDSNGRAIDAEGMLLTRSGDTVLRFRPQFAGMGSFTFTPQKGEQYATVIHRDSTVLLRSQLPEAAPGGFTLHLTPNQKELYVNIASTETRHAPVYLVVHHDSDIQFSGRQLLNNGDALFVIDRSVLKHGITHFTLFNEDQQPVCDRLFFERPDSLTIRVSSPVAAYEQRSKVTLAVETPSAACNLSMSVYRLDALQQRDELSINNWMWLGRDVQGPIAFPQFYFERGDSAAAAADLLMLTHGWSRFLPKSASTDEPAMVNAEREGRVVRFLVTDKKTGAPAEGIRALLAIAGGNTVPAYAVSDRRGILQFIMEKIAGPQQLVIQPIEAGTRQLRLQLVDSAWSFPIAGAGLTPYRHVAANNDALVMHSINVQAVNSYQRDSLMSRYASVAMDSVHFYGRPDLTYMLDDYTRFPSLEEVIHEYVQTVSVRKSKGQPTIKVFNRNAGSLYDGSPMMLVDGVPVTDAARVLDMNPLRLKRIDVIGDRYFIGRRSWDGLLSFSSYDNDLNGLTFDANTLLLNYEALQPQRTFYSPSYDTEARRRDHAADLRELLYWNPNISTRAGSATPLSFYTGDQRGTFLVVTQGIGANGLPAYHSFTFDVK